MTSRWVVEDDDNCVWPRHCWWAPYHRHTWPDAAVTSRPSENRRRTGARCWRRPARNRAVRWLHVWQVTWKMNWKKSTTILQRSYKKHLSLKRSDIVKRDKHCNSFNETSKVITVIWNALNFKLSKPFKTLQPSIYQCHVIIIFAALQTSKFG